jgi:hypothetical protein
MPVSKHRKKKKRKSAKRKKIQATDFVAVKFPFSDVPRETLIKGLIEAGKSYQDSFQKDLARVVEILHSVDTLQTISALSMYGLFWGVSDKGEFSPFQKESQFTQVSVELIQAIALQVPENKQSLTPPHPEIIQELFDILPELGKAFSLQRLRVMEEERTENKKSVSMLQEHLRLHTQAIRNWGYFKRAINIVKRLCEPIDLIFTKQLGITATDLINTFEYLVRRSEHIVNGRWTTFRTIFAEKTVENILRKYYELTPHFTDSPEAFIEFAKQEELTLDQVKSLMLSYSDLSLADEMSFTTEELCRVLGLPPAALSAALDRLSLSFGELANQRTVFFFLDNPVWRKPLIKLSKDRFFCATPQVFFSFIFPIFEDLLKGNESARACYQDRRAQFLESEIARLFTQAFPGCEIAANYKWKDVDKEYENDLLVRVDSHLILVEAKSGTVFWPALRGAPDRARRHVEELLLEPSNQSLRLATRIVDAIARPELCVSLLPNFPIAIEEVRTVLRLSVTLEDFAVLQSNLHMVKETSWIPKDHPISACVLLADLEIVFDILEMTAQKIHYIKRRSELEANMNYMGDEIDLLGFYLVSGFNIGDTEFNGDHIQLTRMSQNIDEYYIAFDEGFQRTKPKLKLTQWWTDICKEIEERNFHQWSDVANVMLSFSFSEQQNIERHFNNIKKNVLKHWQNENHLCSTTVIPNMHRSEALGLYAYREVAKANLKNHMDNIASRIFDNPHVQRCLILGVNIDKEHYPYSTLALFFR